MTLTSRSPTEYTNGRLVLDADMAYELLEALRSARVRMLVGRSEMLDDAGLPEAAKYYDRRLATIKKIRNRTLSLMAEKGWRYEDDET